MNTADPRRPLFLLLADATAADSERYRALARARIEPHGKVRVLDVSGHNAPYPESLARRGRSGRLPSPRNAGRARRR